MHHMEIRLPKGKLQCIHQELSPWLHRKTATEQDILSLVGLLQHATEVIRSGRTFVSRMYSTAATLSNLTFFHIKSLQGSGWMSGSFSQYFADTITMVPLPLQELYTYSPGQTSYLNFCSMIQHTSIPANKSKILLFVTHLATSGLSYTTIKVYLSAIRSMHVVTGQHIVFNQQLTPLLQQVLKDYNEPTPSISHPRSDGQSPCTS